MIEYNLSKTLKEYQEKNGISFTDSEIATLIYNSRNTYKDIYESLLELREKTEDTELRKQIGERVEDTARELQAFTTNNGTVIYELDILDSLTNKYELEGMFLDFYLAHETGSIGREEFRIIKHKIFSNKESTLKEKSEEEYLDHKLGYTYFSENNSLMLLSSREHSSSLDLYNECRFEEQYVKIKHPFRKGDIIKCIASDEYAIVDSFDTDDIMEEYIEWQDEIHCDFHDIAIHAVFLNMDSDKYKLENGSVFPTNIEICSSNDLNSLEPSVREYLINNANRIKNNQI